jgi:hypothetical protein
MFAQRGLAYVLQIGLHLDKTDSAQLNLENKPERKATRPL